MSLTKEGIREAKEKFIKRWGMNCPNYIPEGTYLSMLTIFDLFAKALENKEKIIKNSNWSWYFEKDKFTLEDNGLAYVLRKKPMSTPAKSRLKLGIA